MCVARVSRPSRVRNIPCSDQAWIWSTDACPRVRCPGVTPAGDVSNLEAPYSPVGPDNSTSGPFGPFEREVELTHPVDVTVPVESRMGLGILEFRFQKGFPPVVV